MHLKNHNGEKFEIRIFGNQLDNLNNTIKWWFRSSIILTENGKRFCTKLDLLTEEDLFLLKRWLEDIYSGNHEKTMFQFVDGHVWFRLWKRGKERFIRFFMQKDEYRKYCWDWRIRLDEKKVFLKSIEYLFLNLRGVL